MLAIDAPVARKVRCSSPRAVHVAAAVASCCDEEVDCCEPITPQSQRLERMFHLLPIRSEVLLPSRSKPCGITKRVRAVVILQCRLEGVAMAQGGRYAVSSLPLPQSQEDFFNLT